jgi:hypothetical protein
MIKRACWPVLLFAACSKPAAPPPLQQVTKADPCETAIDKVLALAKRRSGRDSPPGQREAAIEECRKAPESERAEIACINKAEDDDAIVRCFEEREAAKGEPAVELAHLVQQLRTYYFVHETFPRASVALTPAQACCSFPAKKCSSAGQWTDQVWKILELDLEQEHLYQYRYEGDGRKAIVEAVGDPDCDGKTLTYRRELEFRDDGNMHITVTDPPADSD